VLEVGCQQGEVTMAISKAARHVIGIDIDRKTELKSTKAPNKVAHITD